MRIPSINSSSCGTNNSNNSCTFTPVHELTHRQAVHVLWQPFHRSEW